MEFPEIDILHACQAAEQCQREMVPLLASAIGVPVEAVFDTWATRKCRQHGELPGIPWQYFFHGLECDLKNTADGRFLRLDFGPAGRIDTFSAYGVLQFIMTSTAPWPEFTALQRLFAAKEPPYDQLSGNFPKFCEHWRRLEAHDCFTVADPTLVEFLARWTVIEPSGIQSVRCPPETSEETLVHCLVAHRECLSPHARRLLDAGRSTTANEVSA